ncbi:hypothetical protein HG536_0A01010 [Torulaspora globosa]|uniref:2',3'-cyclic-nucleotide 3'-phosphodiesterase n=1 Tax=Torulaspora globosa TaxID=48254 RepID=A0A7G3Z9U8_9SACH|nr:uncharacterized protein HG536_0A01010 [Torulaspora globosa]QLL30284.1 hypothetical protein HG536_0A01010 [Torulaspora globosa]
MTIALWYCPQQGSAAYEILELLIESLQSIFPSSPRFEPHITITNNLVCNDPDDVNKILTSCVAAVQSIKPLLGSASSGGQLVSFKRCSVGKKFFDKVVLECHENRYLISIAQIMRELYVEIDDTSRSQRAATWARDEFRPHLSLLYSETYPISQAFLRIIQQRIEDALDVQLRSLPATGGDRQLAWQLSTTPTCSWSLPGTFKVVKCEGPVDEWQVLGRTDV